MWNMNTSTLFMGLTIKQCRAISRERINWAKSSRVEIVVTLEEDAVNYGSLGMEGKNCGVVGHSCGGNVGAYDYGDYRPRYNGENA